MAAPHQNVSSAICEPDSHSVLATDKNSSQLLPGVLYSATEHQVLNPAFNGTVNETATSVYVSEPALPLSFARVNYSGSATTLSSAPGNWSSLYLPFGWYASVEPSQVLFGSIPDRSQLSEDFEITAFANGEFLLPGKLTCSELRPTMLF